jgi:hypothetical protein
MPWFLLASGVYFGFGPLVYFFGNDAAIRYCQDVWLVDPYDIITVTCLNIFGVVVVFGVWLWVTRSLRVVTSLSVSQQAMSTAILCFYLVGLPARLIAVLADCGLLSFQAPGFINWVANLTNAGLVLLTVKAFRENGGWWLLWGSLLLLDIVGGMVAFSKVAILMAVFPCILGYVLYRPSGKALKFLPLILFAAYFAAHSFVSLARAQVISENSLVGRLELSQFVLNSKEDERQTEVDQAWWTRLNYANAQSFALKEYDSGVPGDSLKLALIAPIPRLLWPGKPIIESGRGFYRKLTGHESATFGVGFFAEAYWNGGWLAVLLCSCAVGWIFGRVTLFIVNEQTSGRYWVLPIALLWIRSGTRVDGWMHTEIVGPGVFTLIYVLVFKSWFGDRVIPPLRSRPFNAKGLIKSDGMS